MSQNAQFRGTLLVLGRKEAIIFVGGGVRSRHLDTSLVESGRAVLGKIVEQVGQRRACAAGLVQIWRAPGEPSPLVEDITEIRPLHQPGPLPRDLVTPALPDVTQLVPLLLLPFAHSIRFRMFSYLFLCIVHANLGGGRLCRCVRALREYTEGR